MHHHTKIMKKTAKAKTPSTPRDVVDADHDAADDAEDVQTLPSEEARRYAEAFVKNGGHQKRAAVIAWPDVSPKTAQIRASRAGRDPRVRAYIAEITEAVKRDAAYDARAAFHESGAALRAASEAGQWSAVSKLIELRAKLAGLLIDRVDLTVNERLSLRDALAQREERLAERAALDIVDVEILAPGGVEHRAPEITEQSAATVPWSLFD